jgi:hypothetical protein
MFTVKDQDGKIIEKSIASTMIEAIYLGCDFDGNLEAIVDQPSWFSSKSPDAIRKRVKRAGFTIVPVKIVEIKNR